MGLLWLYRILPPYVLNGKIFEENLLNVIARFEILNKVFLEYF